MKFNLVSFGDHFTLEKGISYKGEELVETSEVGLVTLDSFRPGGGYKTASEKPYEGDFKQSFVLSPGDVIIAATDITQDGTVLCAPALIPAHENSYSELVWSLDVAKLQSKSGEIRPEFVYNFLRVPLNRKRAAYGDTGTTVRRIPFEAMYEQVIPAPSLEAQDRINSFIATFDRKIEVNSSMAETLHAIAQALFRSWFIDFDPVKAKMAGENPLGMGDETAALFPESMEDSPLGLIPKGWQVVPAGEVLVKQKPGKLYDQKSSNREGLIPVLDQGRSGVVGYHNDAPGYVATPVNPVVVFANHTCSLRFIAYPFSVIQNVFPILGNNLSVYWLYFSLLGKQQFESYKGHWPDLVIKPVVRPIRALTEEFEKLVSPLMKLVWQLDLENQKLIDFRDELLPRLISGEIQIPKEIAVW